MIVTPEAPVKAVNMAHAKRATRASPAGIHPKRERKTLIMRWGDLLSDIKKPANVKRGIV